MTSLAIFMSVLIMTPVWTEVYNDAIVPYNDPDVPMTVEEAWEAGVQPIRQFMIRQIDIAENHDDVLLFYQYLPNQSSPPKDFDDIPLQVLVPAFMLSELKTAFMLGFQIYSPFVVLDLVISSTTNGK